MNYRIADLFCGAGGTSAGAVEAMTALGRTPILTAINHWPVAVATHTVNHPESRHLCTGIDSVNPRELFGEGELDMLWASPECTHHSIAQGFPHDYHFTGTKTDQVKQIGNAVPRRLARAIVAAVVSQNEHVGFLVDLEDARDIERGAA